MKELSWKNLWGARDIAIIETIDLCFPRYDQLQWNNDISVLFWPIHSQGNLFCVTGGLQGTTQLMCARDQGEESFELERQRGEWEEGHYFVRWPLLGWALTYFPFLKFVNLSCHLLWHFGFYRKPLTCIKKLLEVRYFINPFQYCYFIKPLNISWSIFCTGQLYSIYFKRQDKNRIKMLPISQYITYKTICQKDNIHVFRTR